MQEQARRAVVVFLVLSVAGAALDLWTKDWAARNLATDRHPLVLSVVDDDLGKTVGEWQKKGPFPEGTVGDLIRLPPPLDVRASQELKPLELWSRGHAGWYLFLDATFQSSPRFILNPVRQTQRAMQGKEGWREQWKDRVMRWGEMIQGDVSFLSVEDIDGLLQAGLLFPVQLPLDTVREDSPVVQGERFLLMDRSIQLIPGLLQFVYAENPGAAWGFLASAPRWVRQVVLQGFSLVAILAVLVIVWRIRALRGAMTSVVALSLVFGGAAGNLVDRIARHYVVDFIDMYVGSSHWPTYNVADIGITFGVILLAYQMLRKRPPFHEPPKARASA